MLSEPVIDDLGRHTGNYRLLVVIAGEVCGVPFKLEPGLEYDVVSSPCFSQGIFPETGDELEGPAWLHDDTYRNPAKYPGLSRRKADKMFRKYAAQLTRQTPGLSRQERAKRWAKRWTAWWTVRQFGGPSWEKYRGNSY